jgi:alpha-1,2-mannosyltransferase
LLLGLAVLVGFSGVVELRSAFLKRPMTDLQVYLRTAWAVRSGADLYQVTDDNGWHYNYPPLLAILLTPLADPPPYVARDGIPPFGVSVAIWYWLSVGCLVWGVHTLCRALEQTASDDSIRSQPPGCGRWRLLRFLPVLACLPAIGQTLVRGQVNLLVFASLCGFIAAIVRGRRVHAGIWLAGAICLKVIPALLLIYPLWKRDFRCLAGCALGLVIGLGAIPAAVLGPQCTLSYFEEWTEVMLRPALGQGEDQSRVKELINVRATDSQSPLVLLHNAIYPDRETRPFEASTGVRWGHRLIAASMTLMTLLAAGWSRKSNPQREALTLGALIIVMVLASPVCHLHYFCLTLPLIIGMLAVAMTRQDSARRLYSILGLLAVNILCTTLPIFPGMDLLRDHGLATVGTLLLWATGLGMLVFARGATITVSKTVASGDALAA